MIPLDSIPENYVCPQCDTPALSPSVRVLYFERYGDLETVGSFDEKRPPQDQPQRVYCETCDQFLQITAHLANWLREQALNARI